MFENRLRSDFKVTCSAKCCLLPYLDIVYGFDVIYFSREGIFGKAIVCFRQQMAALNNSYSCFRLTLKHIKVLFSKFFKDKLKEFTFLT